MSQYDGRGNAGIAQRFRQISKATTLLVIALGLVGFCGWVFHLPALTMIRPTFAAIKFNTAVLFLCLGIALWMTDSDERKYGRRILGLLVAIVAGSTLAEYAFDINIGIDEFFFRDTHTAIHPGRMSVATATCFLLLGLDVLPTAQKKMRRLQRHGMMVCFAISLTALCGYLYGAASLYSMAPFGTMSLHTAIAFPAACLAYFFARRKDGIMFVAASDTNAGLLLRKLIPVVFIVPIVLGWLTLTGEKVRLYEIPFGISLLVLGSIVCLTALTTMISRSLHHVERERGYVEEALKKSEEKFVKAFRGSPVVLAITSAKDHRYMDVSESFEQWSGWRRDEVIGRTPFDIGIWVNPAERSDFVRQLLDEGVVRNQEFRYRRKDGVEMVGLGSGELIEIGNEPCVISAIADITERKRAEVAVLRHAAIVESSQDAIISKNLDAVITGWNEGAERIFGYTEAEVLGQPSSIIVPPELQDEENKILERLRDGERIEHYETQRVTKTGRKVDVSLSISPVKDSTGRILGFSKIARDISNRKIAEAALRDAQEALRISEERLRLGQWAAHVGTFDLNLRTGVDVWTPETEALYGLPPGSFGGTLTAFENLIHPDDRERVAELTQELIRTGQPVETEWRAVWPDGSVHWIAGRGQVLMDESGKPSRMLGVNMDITERKRAEETVSDMTRKLVEAQEQERSRIGRELHDNVGQRLAILSIALGQLRDKNNLLPEIRDRMQELKQMASDMTTGVHALSHELHSSTMEYFGVVSAMRSWCEEYSERYKLEIDFKSDDVPTLPQDTSLCLFRVLQEALHNAGKYSGVKRIEVQLTKNSGEIHLIVSDSGRGFDVEAARQKRGLGLTSMQERVRLVGGTIAIDSNSLAGTTVHVCVPFRAKSSAQMAAG
jgi:PAS domain S-box-containing protein